MFLVFIKGNNVLLWDLNKMTLPVDKIQHLSRGQTLLPSNKCYKLSEKNDDFWIAADLFSWLT